MEQEVTVKIRSFLQQSLQSNDLTDGYDIFGSGLANSLFALQLVCFIEKEFCCTVENSDLKLDNFRSIAALRALVLSKRA